MDIFPPHELTLNLMYVVGQIDVGESSVAVVHSNWVVKTGHTSFPRSGGRSHGPRRGSLEFQSDWAHPVVYMYLSQYWLVRQTTDGLGQTGFALVRLLLWSSVESTHVCLWYSLSSLSLSLSLLMSPSPSLLPSPFLSVKLLLFRLASQLHSKIDI